MKFFRGVFAALFVWAVFLHAYTPTHPWLTDPENTRPHLDSLAMFWEGTFNTEKGAFYTEIKRNGDIETKWGTADYANTLTQSRNAYAMIRIFMVNGDTSYLNMAERALRFMRAHAWDESRGGWYTVVKMDGSVPYPNDRKTIFQNLYALLGLTAYWECTRDPEIKSWIDETFDVLENRMWDTLHDGYFEYANANWSYPKDKSFNGIVDAITTHLVTFSMYDPESRYMSRWLEQTELILTKLVPTITPDAPFFKEYFSSSWGDGSTDPNREEWGNSGHMNKASWCLARLYRFNPQEAYLEAAELITGNMYDYAFDNEHGGMWGAFNRSTNLPNWNWNKSWWEQQQAVMAGLQLYDLTGKDVYLQMADSTLHFYTRFLVDHQYGGVFAEVSNDGRTIINDGKGGGWKAGYHSSEYAYYVYLYQSLLNLNRPVTLHFRPHESALNCQKLKPLAIEDDRLWITAVERNGESWKTFGKDFVDFSHAEPGDVFTVTFSPDSTVQYVGTREIYRPRHYALQQNYPNPFNATTVIPFTMDKEGQAELTIYQLDGTFVQRILFTRSAGEQTFTWNGTDASGRDVASGIYVYQLRINGRHAGTRTMVMMK